MSDEVVILLLLRSGSRKRPIRSSDCARKQHLLNITCFAFTLFTFVQVIVSICMACTSNKQSAVFAAIWSMLLAFGFNAVSWILVYDGKRLTELQLGLFIGTSAMLAELFFVLAVIFYITGINASANNQQVGPYDQAFATISLVNTASFGIWTLVLTTHRQLLLMKMSPETSTAIAVPVFNPVAPSAPMADVDDQEQL